MLTKEPYTLNIHPVILEDLQERLLDTRWPIAYTNTDWNYGVNIDYMKALINHWLHNYNWRKHEEELNNFKHFKAEVDGVNIHFIHEKGKGPNPKPLILTHGWPDSFYRFHKVIPMLTDPEKYGGSPEDAFDVIVPSIPGFGFSDRKAMSSGSVADLWLKLMQGLGYQKFAAAGGDAGSIITKYLAFKYPESITGIHLTDVGYPDFMNLPADLSSEEQKFVEFLGYWWQTEGAFNMIHSTKPQTLGYTLNDSPAGLAAWTTILLGGKEPFGFRFDPDEQLTNIMIYWVTETINSSLQYYLIEAQSKSPIEQGQRIETPTAVLHCTEDAPLPLDWAKRNVNVVQYNEMKAGHFAAWENPIGYTDDIRTFFRKLARTKNQGILENAYNQ